MCSQRILQTYPVFHTNNKPNAHDNQQHTELQSLSTEDFHKNHAGEQTD